SAEERADPRPDPLSCLTVRELLDTVETEVARLPEVYRLPVVLCCFEGLSQQEASVRLGWSPGSVRGRLERGRRGMDAGLGRRGGGGGGGGGWRGGGGRWLRAWRRRRSRAVWRRWPPPSLGWRGGRRGGGWLGAKSPLWRHPRRGAV